MKEESHILPLGKEFYEIRNRLRVVGYDLVSYSKHYAQKEAEKLRHSPNDYKFAIHKIEYIEFKTGEIYINMDGYHSSEKNIEKWSEHFIEQEQTLGLSIIKDWFMTPATLILTIVVLPYGLACLILTLLGDRRERLEQLERKNNLHKFCSMPKFWRKNQHNNSFKTTVQKTHSLHK